MAADRFGLTKVLFIPAGIPPHKNNAAVASYEDRVHMAELACACDARFEVSRVEAPEPSGASTPSYTIVAIEKLRGEGLQSPGFLIGADAFAELRQWYRWQDVVASVEFIVVTRPGALWETPPGAIVHQLTGIESPVSSSLIRERIANGGSDLPVPSVVMDYIREHELYRSQVA